MRRRSRSRRNAAAATAAGFTLIELLLVLAIVGIIIAFILTAAMDGVRRAEERATQALITKLEMGMTDRVDAITATRADALPSHQYFAGIWWNSTGWVPAPPDSAQAPFGTAASPGTTNPVVNNIRAQILARFDQVRAELPDVFFVQSDKNYPLNFVAVAYPLGTELSGSPFPPSGYGRFLLPMGVGVLNDPAGVSSSGISVGGNPPLTFPYTLDTTVSPPALVQFPPVTPASTGIFGASYTAAAGLYKSLFESVQRDNPAFGAPTPQNAGFDGVDNDGDGLVDNITENDVPKSTAISTAMKAKLANHTHKTARAEMLYALLVNGQGPFGSSFSRDDFSDAEVRDTDNDGLPEFVDAWGEPLQYFRWPIFHQSDTQRGPGFYGPLETRDVNTLDPNQTLVDPAWWNGSGAGLSNANSPYAAAVTLKSSPASSLSGSAVFFQAYFHSLIDPNTDPNLKFPATTGQGWDRGSAASPFFARREYYSKFVILSGGPDKTPGVPILDPSYFDALGQYAPSGTNVSAPASTVIGPGGSGAATVNLMVESQAAQATPFGSSTALRSGPFFSFLSTWPQAFTPPPPTGVYPGPISGLPSPAGPQEGTSIAIREAGNDDISNQNLSSPGGATQ